MKNKLKNSTRFSNNLPKPLKQPETKSKQKIISALVLSAFGVSLATGFLYRFADPQIKRHTSSNIPNITNDTLSGSISLYTNNDAVWYGQSNDFPTIYTNLNTAIINDNSTDLSKTSLADISNSLNSLSFTYYWYANNQLITTTSSPSLQLTSNILPNDNLNTTFNFYVVAKSNNSIKTSNNNNINDNKIILTSNKLSITLNQQPTLKVNNIQPYYVSNGQEIPESSLSTFYKTQTQDIQYLKAGNVISKDAVCVSYNWYVNFVSSSNDTIINNIALASLKNTNTLISNANELALDSNLFNAISKDLNLNNNDNSGYYSFYCIINAKMKNGATYKPYQTKTFMITYASFNNITITSNQNWNGYGLINDVNSVNLPYANPSVIIDTNTNNKVSYTSTWQIKDGNKWVNIWTNTDDTTWENVFYSYFKQAGSYTFRCAINGTFEGGVLQTVYSPLFDLHISDPVANIGTTTYNLKIIKNAKDLPATNSSQEGVIEIPFNISGLINDETNNDDLSVSYAWSYKENNGTLNLINNDKNSLNYANYINLKNTSNYVFSCVVSYSWFNQSVSKVVYTFSIDVIDAPTITLNWIKSANNNESVSNPFSSFVANQNGDLPTLYNMISINEYEDNLYTAEDLKISYEINNGSSSINLSSYVSSYSNNTNFLNGINTLKLDNNVLAEFFNVSKQTTLTLAFKVSMVIQGVLISNQITDDIIVYPMFNPTLTLNTNEIIGFSGSNIVGGSNSLTNIELTLSPNNSVYNNANNSGYTLSFNYVWYWIGNNDVPVCLDEDNNNGISNEYYNVNSLSSSISPQIYETYGSGEVYCEVQWKLMQNGTEIANGNNMGNKVKVVIYQAPEFSLKTYTSDLSANSYYNGTYYLYYIQQEKLNEEMPSNTSQNVIVNQNTSCMNATSSGPLNIYFRLYNGGGLFSDVNSLDYNNLSNLSLSYGWQSVINSLNNTQNTSSVIYSTLSNQNYSSELGLSLNVGLNATVGNNTNQVNTRFTSNGDTTNGSNYYNLFLSLDYEIDGHKYNIELLVGTIKTQIVSITTYYKLVKNFTVYFLYGYYKMSCANTNKNYSLRLKSYSVYPTEYDKNGHMTVISHNSNDGVGKTIHISSNKILGTMSENFIKNMAYPYYTPDRDITYNNERIQKVYAKESKLSYLQKNYLINSNVWEDLVTLNNYEYSRNGFANTKDKYSYGNYFSRSIEFRYSYHYGDVIFNQNFNTYYSLEFHTDASSLFNSDAIINKFQTYTKTYRKSNFKNSYQLAQFELYNPNNSMSQYYASINFYKQWNASVKLHYHYIQKTQWLIPYIVLAEKYNYTLGLGGMGQTIVNDYKQTIINHLKQDPNYYNSIIYSN